MSCEVEQLVSGLELCHVVGELSAEYGVEEGEESCEEDEEGTKELCAMELALRRMEADMSNLAALEKELLEKIDGLSHMPRQASSFQSLGREDTEEYVVTQILGKRSSGHRQPMYLCVWSGDGGLSWELEEDLECITMVEEYEGRIREKWLRIVEQHQETARRKFAERAAKKGYTVRSQLSRKAQQKRKDKKTPKQPPPVAPQPPVGGNGGYYNYYGEPAPPPAPAGPPSDHEMQRLLHLDLPALRQYLQTVVDFTPLHYELLLRLSEDDVSRGASKEALAHLRHPTAADYETGSTVRPVCCTICLDPIDYASLSSLALLPCSHTFHASCIREWFEGRKTCPLCNVEV